MWGDVAAGFFWMMRWLGQKKLHSDGEYSNGKKKLGSGKNRQEKNPNIIQSADKTYRINELTELLKKFEGGFSS
ncbi:MAG: hypothetical protein CM15mP3_10320 [Candidatus Poseidoniales archaeon]|nr:MAG: hypothetical protein CM15mP3_10320 [Candidatus Poseidoniales archaeon]